MEQKQLNKLESIAKQFIKDEYKLDLDIPIKINSRFKTTLGIYRETHSGIPVQIEIAKRLLQYANKRVIIGVIKHEIVHLALKKLNKPYKDGDDYFEQELERLNLPSSVNKERSIAYVGEKYIFICQQCKRKLTTTIKKVKQKSKLYISPCCRSGLKYVKTTICDGTHNGVCRFLT